MRRTAFASVLVLASAVAQAQLSSYGNLLLTDAAPDANAHFGATLATGDFDGDGDADLAIGARRAEDLDGGVTLVINDDGVLQPGRYGGTLAGEGSEQLGTALVACDVDGNGRDDLAIGAPGNSDFGGDSAGAVYIYTLAPISGLDGWLWTRRQTLAQGDLLGSVSVQGDRLGSALACGDFDGDGYDDLAIGAPQKDVSVGIDNAGQVVVIHGSATGLSSLTDEIWNQDTARDGVDVNGVAEADDLFGSALASGDFDGDGFDDLVIGVPAEDVSGSTNTGAVHVLFGSDGRLTPVGQRLVTVATFEAMGLGAGPGNNDRFGSSLAVGDFDHGDHPLDNNYADLAIGAPDRAYGGRSHAGTVFVLQGGYGAALFEDGNVLTGGDTPQAAQDFEYFGDALAAARIDGDSRDDLVIGRHGRSIDVVESAGAVTVFFGEEYTGFVDAGQQFLYASRGYASGPPQYVAGYGVGLAAADFDADGRADLAVGIYGQPVAGIDYAGAVQMVFTRGLFADGLEF